MSISLKEIAEATNVSKTTVSWVLRGMGDDKGIRTSTQEAIIAYAKKHNYQPNLLALSLHSGRSNTIGLIVPYITDSFFSQIVHHIVHKAEMSGYSLMVGVSESDTKREERLIQLFRQRQADGILLASTQTTEEGYRQFSADNYPFVLFDRYRADAVVNHVIIDNKRACHDIVAGMIAQGAKKIAIVTVVPHLHNMNMRYQGYLDALHEAGIQAKPSLYMEVPFEEYAYENFMYEALDKIFRAEPDTDGIFFTSHILANGSFKYFFDKNINVRNGQVHLGCLHSIPAFQYLAPHMVVAQQPVKELANESLRILMQLIKHKNNSDPKNPKGKTEKVILQCPLYLKAGEVVY